MRKLIILVVIFLATQANGAVFFQDSFESGNLSSPTTTDSSSWGSSAAHTAGGDEVGVSNEFARTGSYALRFFFNGNADLADTALAEQYFNIGGTGRREMYISYWIYLPTNYITRNGTSTDNTKIMTTWGDTYGVDGVFNIETSGTSHDIKIRQRRQPPTYLTAQCPEDGGVLSEAPGTDYWSLSSTNHYPDGFDLRDERGSWSHWVFYLKMDDGSNPSIVRMWVDGVLVIETIESTLGAPCDVPIRHGYLMGQANSGFTDDTTVYIDDVQFATTYEDVSGLIDTTAPTTLLSTTDPSSISTDARTATGTASDAVGVVGCKYRIGSAPNSSNGTACTGTTSFSCATSGYSSGANTLYVGCYDAAGNYGSDSIVVNYTPAGVGSASSAFSGSGTFR